MVTPPTRPPGSNIVGRLFSSLFFLVFLGMGSVFFVAFARAAILHVATYRWTRTEATVMESRVDEPTSHDGKRTLYVRYHYTYDGSRYVSDRYDRETQVNSSSDAYRLAQTYTPGSVHPCYVNPAHPTEAVLHRGGLGVLALTLFPLVFVAVGAIGIIGVWTKRSVTTAAQRPITSTATANAPKTWFLVLFFGIFLIVGTGLTYAMLVKPLLKIQAARSWQEVPCEIVSSRVQSNRGSKSTTYSVDIVFRYHVGDRVYTGSNYNFLTGSSSSYEWKADAVNANPAGRATVCYVNPNDATEAVLDRSPRAEMAFGLFPLIFFGVGLGGIVWALRRPTNSPPSWSAKTLPSAPQQSPLVSIDIGELSGPTILRPKSSRLAKAIGLLLAGVFWNGIVSFFVYDVVHGWIQGRGSIFETLFMIPFLLVGIGLIVGAGYQALALANPNARMTVSRSAARLGDTIEIQWEFEGATSRLRGLRIELEGREEATYRRGTNTSTDRSVFARIVGLDTSDPMQIRSGSVRLQIPSDTMHSFKSANNQIVWSLRLKGDIPRWPDIDDEYPLQVLPLPLSVHGHERT